MLGAGGPSQHHRKVNNDSFGELLGSLVPGVLVSQMEKILGYGGTQL